MKPSLLSRGILPLVAVATCLVATLAAQTRAPQPDWAGVEPEALNLRANGKRSGASGAGSDNTHSVNHPS